MTLIYNKVRVFFMQIDGKIAVYLYWQAKLFIALYDVCNDIVMIKLPMPFIFRF